VALVMAGCGTKTTAGEAENARIAVITSIAKSADATADADGLAQVDSTVVAVTVDKNGKITACKIDAAQTKINFSVEGKVTTPLDTAFKSKQEMGTEYGMGSASGIKKEWNEQASAFADYVVGKTVAEVKGIAVSAEGVPTDAELTASVTIHIGDFVAGIEKAVNNAKDVGAKTGDKLGLGVMTTIDKSADAGAEDGVAQAYSKYAATTYGADGKIKSCVIDSSQTEVTFSAEGKLTADLAAVPQTKNELGDAYGMKKASGIGKEWFQQAEALAGYVVGKTFAEVKGIAVDAEGVATDSELAGSVTISIPDYIAVIEKSGGK